MDTHENYLTWTDRIFISELEEKEKDSIKYDYTPV